MNAEDYDDLYKNNPKAWEEDTTDELIKEFVTGETIDLGCGNGRTIKKIDDKGIVGVDFSEEALKIAKDKNFFNAFLKCDMRYTPFEPYRFDTVMSIGSHEHLEVIDFNEVHRLLKKSGLFVCVLPVCEEDRGWVGKGLQTEWKLTRETWIKHLLRFRLKEIDTDKNKENVFICQPI